jgi:hypothetical protein
MNWILGMKRLWVLASILFITWVCGKTWDMTGRCSNYPDSLRESCETYVPRVIFEGAALSVAVPVAMYIVGAAVIWVVRGFLQKAPQA